MIIDSLMKSTHFLSVGTIFSANDYKGLYNGEIRRLYVVPISIISDRGGTIYNIFLKIFLEGSGDASKCRSHLG